MTEESKTVLIALGAIIGVVAIISILVVGSFNNANNNQLIRWEKCMEVVQDDVYCKGLIYPTRSN